MKNIFKFSFLIIIFIFSFLLTACNRDNDTKVSADEVKEWIDNNISGVVAESITLPTEYMGAKITWVSEAPWYIDDKGVIVDREKRVTDVVFDYHISTGSEGLDGQVTLKLTPVNLDTLALRFETQIPKVIFEDVNFTTIYYNGVQVVWESSNQDVLTNEGVYNKPNVDTDIVISYVISDKFTKLEYEVPVKVQGMTVMDYFREASAWLQTEFLPDRFIQADKIDLPKQFKDSPVAIVWESSDKYVIDPDTGNTFRTLYDRYCLLTANVSIEDHKASYTTMCVVAAKDISKMTEAEILEEFLNNIAVEEKKETVYNIYSNMDQSYSSLAFFDNSGPTVVESIFTGSNRPGYIKTSTEYITVHDTANNSSGATAQMHASYLRNGGGGASWHYTVDEDGAYHNIPNNEVAWHAGDGGRRFALVDTGVKADAVMPIITMEDGYYVLNGHKTTLRPYADRDGFSFVTKDYDTSYFNKLGFIVEVGKNGNWYMGKTYLNTDYNRLSNFGGNYNSVGIETCVNSGADFEKALRELAKLVAQLCIDHNLTIHRVQGHNYFSGKPCPNALINPTTHGWYNFKNLVSLEKFGTEHFSNYTFTWKSNSSYLNDKGFISKSIPQNTTVNYSVVVKDNKGVTVASKSYSTLIR